MAKQKLPPTMTRRSRGKTSLKKPGLPRAVDGGKQQRGVHLYVDSPYTPRVDRKPATRKKSDITNQTLVPSKNIQQTDLGQNYRKRA